MKALGILALTVLLPGSALAQTKQPATKTGNFGPPEPLPPGFVLDKPAPQRYSPKDCSNFLKWNPQLGDEAEVSLVSWCLAYTRSAAIRKQLLTDLRVYGWADGYNERLISDTPSAGIKPCSDIDRMVGVESWASTQAESDSINKAMDEYEKLSSEERRKLENRVTKCALYGDADDRLAANTFLINIKLDKGFDGGWTGAWTPAWSAGWDAGIKAQMDLDGKVLRDVAAKDDDRYNDLVKDYNALAAEYHEGAIATAARLLGIARPGSRVKAGIGLAGLLGFHVHRGSRRLAHHVQLREHDVRAGSGRLASYVRLPLIASGPARRERAWVPLRFYFWPRASSQRLLAGGGCAQPSACSPSPAGFSRCRA